MSPELKNDERISHRKTKEDTAERITTTEIIIRIIIRIIRIVVVQFNLAIISIRIEIEVRNRAVYVRYPSRDTGARLLILLNFIWKH